MTERQILLHFDCYWRLRKFQRAEQLIDMNLAFAGGEEAEKRLSDLTK